jgi:DNA-binding NtrC family response regulator
LRERGDDIVRLAQSFLKQHAHRYRREVSAFSDAALSALKRYAWPGNVRELSHVIERAVLMCAGKSIGPTDLALGGAAPAATATAAADRRSIATLEEIELNAIRAALGRHDGNVIAAAEELGMSRSALYRRMEKLKS